MIRAPSTTSRAIVSYTRYFLARILQFQFQRALCEAAGHEGELQSCSVYGSKEAGAKLHAMLEPGQACPGRTRWRS